MTSSFPPGPPEGPGAGGRGMGVRSQNVREVTRARPVRLDEGARILDAREKGVAT